MDFQLLSIGVMKLFDFLDFLIQAYNLVFFIWILSTWFPVNRSIIILRFVDGLISPLYNFLLEHLPPLRLGMMDFSPFYMMLFLQLLQWGLIYLRIFLATHLLSLV